MKRAIIVAWIAIGVLNFGGSNGDARGSFPRLAADAKQARQFCGFAAFMAVSGPLAFPAVLFSSGFYSSGLSYDCGSVKP